MNTICFQVPLQCENIVENEEHPLFLKVVKKLSSKYLTKFIQSKFQTLLYMTLLCCFLRVQLYLHFDTYSRLNTKNMST